MNFYSLILTVILSLGFANQSPAQSTSFKSSLDEELTIKGVVVAPVVDNVSNIYGTPLTGQLKAIAESNKQWSVSEWPESRRITPEELEEKPQLVQQILQRSNSQGLLIARVSKGPKGISLKLNLFSGKDGLLTAQDSIEEFQGFEVADLRNQLDGLYKRLLNKLPFQGHVLSRRGNLVTLNVGQSVGFQAGDILNVVQIIKVNRHPKFKFIVSTEKEILGRLVITKADEYLSFANIEMERDSNVIQPNQKVLAIEFKTYTSPETPATPGLANELSQRPDAPIAFGEKPGPWLPRPAPTFGKVALLFGLGPYSINNTLNTSGAVESQQTLTPSLNLEGEMWITQQWYASLELRQFLASMKNDLAGSGPSQLNLNSLQTSLHFGYYVLLGEDFWGPKMQIFLGQTSFKSTIDQSSPTAFTSMSFSSLSLGLGMSFPVSDEIPLTLAGKLKYFWGPSVSESPVTSGSSSSARMGQFNITGTYRLKQHLNLRGDLNYDLYSASFSGTGTRSDSASSASHKITTIGAGFEYLF
ncbi:MAG: autotransporter outer membrane beta-barrel domain-containing protein [Pseudobdellovibrionaceae bacterium]